MAKTGAAARHESEAGTAVSIDLHHEITLFLYREARLLDEERYRDWLASITTDIHYWIPFRENRFRKDRRPEPGPEDAASLYNDNYDDLEDRVKRAETGLIWSEDPKPRISRTITNIEVEHAVVPGEIDVYSNIELYRNRRQDEEIWYNGKRRDRLRRVDGMWKLAQRHVFLNHHVLLDENISVLF